MVNADKIMVLDAGNLVEYDTSARLMKQKDSSFKPMIDESNDKVVLWTVTLIDLIHNIFWVEILCEADTMIRVVEEGLIDKNSLQIGCYSTRYDVSLNSNRTEASLRRSFGRLEGWRRRRRTSGRMCW